MKLADQHVNELRDDDVMEELASTVIKKWATWCADQVRYYRLLCRVRWMTYWPIEVLVMQSISISISTKVSRAILYSIQAVNGIDE